MKNKYFFLLIQKIFDLKNIILERDNKVASLTKQLQES